VTREELGKKIEETWFELDKAKNAIYMSDVRNAFLKLFDEWTAEVIGNDMAINTGTTATAPTRNLPGNPGNEHMFAFEDGLNRRGAEARKRAGLPENHEDHRTLNHSQLCSRRSQFYPNRVHPGQ